MTETHISLYGDTSEAFDRVADQMGPEGCDLSNAAVVRRLIESYESDELTGGIKR